MNQYSYIDAGFRVFGLYGANDGVCECQDPECEALFKHPRFSSWQHTPEWSDEQLETFEEMGHFKTGFGVLCDGWLIIDVDPRNGGDKSYEQLKKDLGVDLDKESGFIVRTGGGGLHVYFKAPDNKALLSHLKEYAGIDFKVSGFVVGCGSLHASGSFYEEIKGDPDDVGNAPQKLIDALEKPEHFKASVDGVSVDVTEAEIIDMLSKIDPDCDYETWVTCGMAVHHSTGGDGFAVWDDWSNGGQKYAGREKNLKKWHSFGKSSNPVTLGTLLYHAEENGYKPPVTFQTDLTDDEQDEKEQIDTAGIDLLRPPGFVGEVTKWINSQCRYPREHLAVAAALSAIGNVAGLRYKDAAYGATSNQFIFCVAGSATGKEAVQQAQAKLHSAAGLGMATHGTIKSEQEVTRNLIEHQCALYLIDEIGILLRKINNAMQKGSTAYLEGVIGILMSAYSKADANMLLSGDLRKDTIAGLRKEIAASQKCVDENEDDQGYHAEKIECYKQILDHLQDGLKNPFLSLIGYTTPVTFQDTVNYEQSTNGFIGRSLIFEEKDTNPKMKKGFKKPDLSTAIDMRLKSLAGGGYSNQVRIQNYGDKKPIPTNRQADDMLYLVQQYFHDMADEAKNHGLEAIPRRGFELVLKTSFVLAIPEGVRTVEHVRWAFALVKRDCEQKINLAASNIASVYKRADEELIRKIISLLGHDHGETTGVIVNRCQKFKREDVLKALANLKQQNKVRSEAAKRNSEKWFLV